eukprot:s219_g17.t1
MVRLGITGVSDFQSIAEAYEAKAQLFKMMLETLEDDKELPTLPPLALPEVDAARLIQIKDGYKQTTLKVVEGAEIIRTAPPRIHEEEHHRDGEHLHLSMHGPGRLHLSEMKRFLRPRHSGAILWTVAKKRIEASPGETAEWVKSGVSSKIEEAQKDTELFVKEVRGSPKFISSAVGDATEKAKKAASERAAKTVEEVKESLKSNLKLPF